MESSEREDAMNNRAKVIAALSSVGMAAFVVSAFALLIDAPVPSCNSVGAAHAHAVAVPMGIRAPDAATPTFYSEMTKVTACMHEGMEVTATGDVDRDFVRMMIPHHQGAIDMAVVLLKYGHDEKVRRLAQSIIVEQGQEIAYMRTLLDPPSDQTSSPDRTADDVTRHP
jgi:DUF305 family protein family protein